MKKFLLLLAVIASGVGLMFGQSAPFVNGVVFSVPQSAVESYDSEENIYELNTPNVTLSMNFTGWNQAVADSLGYSPKIMVATGMGFGVEPAIYSLESATSTFTFPMNEEKWGQPYMGLLNAVCMVCFTKGEGDNMELYMDGEDPLFYQVVLTAPNTYPTKLVSVYPNNDWSEETFAQAYNRGIVQFSFDNVIYFSDNENAVSVTWETSDGEISETYVYVADTEVFTDLSLGWNPMDGNYMAEIRINNPEYDATDVESITITMNGVRSMNQNVVVQSVTLDNNGTFSLKKNAKKPGITSVTSLETTDGTIDVYNLQGMVIKTVKTSEINSLKPGLYIVNGKKYIVH